MTDIDFKRDGQVGDEVWDAAHGNGVIDKILYNNPFGVVVRYGVRRGVLHTYTCRGYKCGGRHAYPTLCWGHREQERLDQGQPPIREPKPLEFKGVPVWAYVSNSAQWNPGLPIMQVIAKGSKTFVAVAGGEACTECADINRWFYAWEVKFGGKG